MNKILTTLVILILSIGTSLNAQKAVSKKEVRAEVKKLSDKKANDALKYARTLYTPNAKKELDNIVKEMTDKEARLLYDYLELINKYSDKKEAEDKKKQETPTPVGKYAKFEFESTSFDFGAIEQGVDTSYTYKFTNTGNDNLHIMTIKSSCGCATPEWPKDPIAPGETGEIKVTYDSAGKMGVQSKRVTIYANTSPQSTFLFLVGEVMKKRE